MTNVTQYIVAFHEKLVDRRAALEDINMQVLLKPSDNILVRFQKTIINALPSSTLNCTDDEFYNKDQCKVNKVCQYSCQVHV